MKKNLFVLAIAAKVLFSCGGDDSDLCLDIEKDHREALKELGNDASENEIRELTELYEWNKSLGGCG